MLLLPVALALLTATLAAALVDDPCFVGDTPGVCISTAKCSAGGGTSTQFQCPGTPADIQCCTKTSCGGGGNCRFDSQCMKGTLVSRLCPGPTDFRCCMPQMPSSGFNLYGVNEVGAEFGQSIIPGKLNTDYIWPFTSRIDGLLSEGMNAFRVAFLADRLVKNGDVNPITGDFDPMYLQDMKKLVKYITDKGAWAIICPHNFGRYPNKEHKDAKIIEDLPGFKSFWQKLATEFKSNRRVIFDTNNEFFDMPQSLVFDLNQAAIYGIREAGATAQLILVEGNDYTKASTWPSVNPSLALLYDPCHNTAFEMHQYFNAGLDGRTQECTSPTIGIDYLAAATTWCQTNNKMCFLGEFGAGYDSICLIAMNDMLAFLTNSKTWIGALWWWAGPWTVNPGPNQYLSIEETSPTREIYLSGLLRFHTRVPVLELLGQSAEIPPAELKLDL